MTARRRGRLMYTSSGLAHGHFFMVMHQERSRMSVLPRELETTNFQSGQLRIEHTWLGHMDPYVAYV